MSHFLSHTACLESSLSVGNETVVGMTAILGYARVSTAGQDLGAQLVPLSAAGVSTDRVFTDKLSGSAKTARPGLAAMLDYARAGDTIVVTAIDRLGRSVAEVTRTIAELGERRIRSLSGVPGRIVPVNWHFVSWTVSSRRRRDWRAPWSARPDRDRTAMLADYCAFETPPQRVVAGALSGGHRRA